MPTLTRKPLPVLKPKIVPLPPPKSLKRSDKEQTWRRLRDLKPHPSQEIEFGREAEDDEIPALAADIAANGLEVPLEITPGNVIISGHRRRLALLHLGHEFADVIIRHDLSERGPNAILDRLF